MTGMMELQLTNITVEDNELVDYVEFGSAQFSILLRTLIWPDASPPGCTGRCRDARGGGGAVGLKGRLVARGTIWRRNAIKTSGYEGAGGALAVYPPTVLVLITKFCIPSLWACHVAGWLSENSTAGVSNSGALCSLWQSGTLGGSWRSWCGALGICWKP